MVKRPVGTDTIARFVSIEGVNPLLTCGLGLFYTAFFMQLWGALRFVCAAQLVRFLEMRSYEN
jgi:hypothetical protein